MTTQALPAPIARYFAADRQSPDAVARCFTAHAIVRDEGRAHRGPEAIRAWKEAASAKYTYAVEPLVLKHQDRLHVVTGRVVGNFPGSPVDLQYRFHLERGLIASLEIAK